MFAGYAHAPTQHGCELPNGSRSIPSSQYNRNYVEVPLYLLTDYYAASNTMSLTRASTSAVSGGAQHVAGPLAGTQGAPVVPQGTLQQPTQQAQPLPPMGIPLSQTGRLLSNLLDIYLTFRCQLMSLN